jgi:hypothetical protein
VYDDRGACLLRVTHDDLRPPPDPPADPVSPGSGRLSRWHAAAGAAVIAAVLLWWLAR